jgi:hypothetical protein
MEGALLPMKVAIWRSSNLSFYGYIWRGEIDKEKYLFIYFIFYILYFIFYILYFIFYILYFIFYILLTTFHHINKNFPLLYPLLKAKGKGVLLPPPLRESLHGTL